MPRKVNKKGSPKRKQRKTSPKRRGRPRKTSPKRKTSPRRKRRLNPPKSLRRLAARKVLEQDFDERDINRFMMRDIVDEINYGYLQPYDKYNRRYVRDPSLVDEDEFRKTTRAFKNYKIDY